MDRILQIIPAPPGTVAEYPPGGEPLPVACFALLAGEDGKRWVEPMVAGSWGIALIGGVFAVKMNEQPGSSLATGPQLL